MAASQIQVRTRAHLNTDLAQHIADAERWQAYAARMNAKAIERGLVSAEEVARGRRAAEEALARLRCRIA